MRMPAKRRVSSTLPVAAPTGGIDDMSPLANMDPSFAVDMVNFFPEAASLRVRYGYREHIANLPSPGKTIMAYRGANPLSNKLFACTDGGIYDITVPSSAPTLVKAITDGDVNWTQFSNIAGNWLIGCNGTDPAFLFNGSTWIDFTTVATPTNPGEISGLAPTDIIGVHQHKNRVWFIAKNSMTAYYWPTNAVAGAATAFPMGGIFKMGGSVNAIFSWSTSSGVTLDDLLVIQSSVGELAAYGGTDPSNASTWALSARCFVGAPLGRRSNVPLNGDVLLLTQYGLVPVSQVVNGGYKAGDRQTTVSARISRTLNSIVRSMLSASGWEIVAAPSFQYIVLSTPDRSGTGKYQFVMNTLTGAWTRFDLNANTFFEYEGEIYFCGDNNSVMKYGDTTVDNVPLDGSAGTPIIAAFQQAYNYFGQDTTSKHFKLVKAIFESAAPPSYILKISADFSPGGVNSLNPPPGVAGVNSLWGTAIWDVSVWSADNAAFHEWVGVDGTGYCASLMIKTKTSVETRFVASHWAFEPGVSL